MIHILWWSWKSEGTRRGCWGLAGVKSPGSPRRPAPFPKLGERGCAPKGGPHSTVIVNP